MGNINFARSCRFASIFTFCVSSADAQNDPSAADRGGPAYPWVIFEQSKRLAGVELGDRESRPLGAPQPMGLSLASADFDEDGVDDIAIGVGESTGGRIVVRRGNADLIYPYSRPSTERRTAGRFTESPFLEAVASLDLPSKPDLMIAGDFDGDGHQDLVSASRGGLRLHLLAGDGKGRFKGPKVIELSGEVTAMAAGEVNRRDGLIDLAIGVNRPEGSALLIYENPFGALRGAPETFEAPASVTSIDLADLDGDFFRDAAAACDTDLLIVRGRDRRLTESAARRKKVLPAKKELINYGFSIAALASGDFAGDYRRDLALVATTGEVHLLVQGSKELRRWGDHLNRAPSQSPVQSAVGLCVARAMISSHSKYDLLVSDSISGSTYLFSEFPSEDLKRWPTSNPLRLSAAETPAALLPMRCTPDALDDLIILDAKTGALTFKTTGPARTHIVNTIGDDVDDNPGDGFCDTDNDSDNGDQCTLRAAIQEANHFPDLDEIIFAVGSGLQTVGTTLEVVREPVLILGGSQPGFIAGGSKPLIDVPSMVIRGGNSVVRNLLFSQRDLQIDSLTSSFISRNSFVEGCFIGVDASGLTHSSPIDIGLSIFTSADNTIGGGVIFARNLIRGLRIERADASGNMVYNNFIGVGLDGMVDLGHIGVTIEAPGNMIGSTAPGTGNRISSSTGVGITLSTMNVADTSVHDNMIQGNVIGTDDPALPSLGNAKAGVLIRQGVTMTLVGGSVVGARNIISGNNIDTIFGNAAVEIESDSTNTRVQGNYIGVGSDGATPIPNGKAGIRISGTSADNTIGGLVALSAAPPPRPLSGTPPGNVISSNGEEGINVSTFSSSGPLKNIEILGNLIGTDSTGFMDRGNGRWGIRVISFSLGKIQDVKIGTFASSSRNVISANGNLAESTSSDGISIEGEGTSTTLVQSNYIGVDTRGNAALGNIGNGVKIIGSSGHRIGSSIGHTGPGDNIISGNEMNGIFVSQVISNNMPVEAIGNLIFGNMIGLGLDSAVLIGNKMNGIHLLDASGNFIGSGQPGGINVISGNDDHGIEIEGDSARFNEIKGNYIGTNVFGGASPPPLPSKGNFNSGIRLSAGASDNVIGQVPMGPNGVKNVISGNGLDGVTIMDGFRNILHANVIGAEVDETTPLGNELDGVFIGGLSQDSDVGGTIPAKGNLIAFNLENGVGIDGDSATNNSILSNRIFENVLLGIDLNNDGVTENDVGDVDFGPNGLQNFPRLLGAEAVSIQGQLDSDPNTEFVIQIFENPASPPGTPDPSGNGEGFRIFHTETVMTDATGITNFNFIGLTLDPSAGYTATATNLATGDTSEFSDGVAITGAPPVDLGDAPDPSFPTLFANNGARHVIVQDFHLGSTVDADDDGQPNADATGDDLDATDDEDGVTLPPAGFQQGEDQQIDVSATLGSRVGLLNAWIDFNADGDWTDPGEQVLENAALTEGVNDLTITVPETATVGLTFARFRLDSAGGLTPDGLALTGEVEDYQVEIITPPLSIQMEAFLLGMTNDPTSLDLNNDGVVDIADLLLAILQGI